MANEIYFIADTHLGHRNIIQHCGRPFLSVEEMDEDIIDGINSAVGERDILYHLGDFGWKGGDLASYRKRIKCQRIHLIRGNHDDRKAVKSAGFESVSELLYLKANGAKLALCHYPFHSWKRGTIHLHGHTHGQLPEKPGRIDVGWDALDNVGNHPVHLSWVLVTAALMGEQGMY